MQILRVFFDRTCLSFAKRCCLTSFFMCSLVSPLEALYSTLGVEFGLGLFGFFVFAFSFRLLTVVGNFSLHKLVRQRCSGASQSVAPTSSCRFRSVDWLRCSRTGAIWMR